ncbi:MAG: hypothetical protein HYT80_07820 [Euryarchaeota archaeon]|nr:hypothetical protein [Euryarchaeota archaeon]
MAFLGGLVGKLIGLAVLLVVLVLGIGIWAYASDYAVEATVTKKDCAAAKPVVFVKTKMFGIEDSTEVSGHECGIIQVGNFVRYHLRTQRTIVYQAEGGTCVYDSATGLC